ncbi:hypothetical protein M9Y10_031187 [Tritrichomonas musculus]|uniref:Protein kinase domain-containing protein n=1 Tax=Tritrichomonas musculus TaxID=1915356 RepID=A0ABR2H3T5_9EUKA
MKVCGYNSDSRLGGSVSGITSKSGNIKIPCQSPLNVPSLLSISCHCQSVWIKQNGEAFAVGRNGNGRIISTISTDEFSEDTKLQILDQSGQPCKFISVVCGIDYVLYQVSEKAKNDKSPIVYSHYNQKTTFLNIGNRVPVSLFGGYSTAAVVDTEGAVIIITKSVFDSPDSEIEGLSLPGKDIAVKVACGDDIVMALGMSGRVYECSLKTTTRSFVPVSELSGIKINEISGTCRHFFAISDDNIIFGRGDNANNKLGMRPSISDVPQFKVIDSLNKYKIVEAFAGDYDSYFKTAEGKIIGCGYNSYCELMLKDCDKKNVYLPEETLITSDATFCIPGNCTAIVFVGVEPPPNTPNRKIDSSKFGLKVPKSSASKPSEIEKMRQMLIDKDKEISSLKEEVKHLKETISSIKEPAKTNFLEIIDIDTLDNLKRIKSLGRGAIEIFESDSNFLTEKVDRNQFYGYIEFIKKSKIDFSYTHEINQLKEIVETQIGFFRKENLVHFSRGGKYRTEMNPNSLELNTLDLSEYKKLEKIGEGSFGKVYKIVKNDTNEIFAAKVSLHEANEFNDDLLMNIHREVNIMSELNYPPFLKFYGFNQNNFKNKPKPTIIIEFASNGSLFQLFETERNERKIDEWTDTKKLINIFGIASGMSYLHARNILHRDLKPGNILLDNYLFPKISDFGLSKQVDESTTLETTKIPETPEYLAPELIKDNLFTKKADVYAFAIIVYEIMTGEKPFENLSNSLEIVNEITKNHGRPKFTKQIPDCYRKLIEKCWSEDPSERPIFKEITNQLKTDPNFITKNVNKEEYFNYVNFVESYSVAFDYNYQTNKPEFNVIKFEKNFVKVNIYLDSITGTQTKKLSIRIKQTDLNKYELIKQVGEGSFGTVFKIREKETNEILAAKISELDLKCLKLLVPNALH